MHDTIMQSRWSGYIGHNVALEAGEITETLEPYKCAYCAHKHELKQDYAMAWHCVICYNNSNFQAARSDGCLPD